MCNILKKKMKDNRKHRTPNRFVRRNNPCFWETKVEGGNILAQPKDEDKNHFAQNILACRLAPFLFLFFWLRKQEIKKFIILNESSERFILCWSSKASYNAAN